MSTPIIETSIATGELAPSVFGRPDLPRFRSAAATLRNMFVGYRGGAYSRAGTAFILYSKQTGRLYPPRLIPFQFSLSQGLALEFGHHYMRVISKGAYVVENPVTITGVDQTNPCVVHATASGGQSATPITAGVYSSYVPGEIVTIAGGIYSAPAKVTVSSTKLIGLQLNSPGTAGYVPGDTINLAGGTQTSPVIVTVLTTRVVSATITSGGAGGSDGTQTVTGTTGTGTPFQASVTVSGGTITAVLGITAGGAYTVNPTVLTAEPVTGAGLAGASLNIKIGVNTFSITSEGVFTANPAGLTFTQGSTSGAGAGATFRYALMAPNAVTISTPGVYTVFPSNPVAQASTTGAGRGVTFTFTQTAASPYQNGDWVHISGVGGMADLNGRTFVIANATSTQFELQDVFGANIDATSLPAYGGGGTAARIFTLTTPYDEQDIKYLKVTQSADVMTICCVNQETRFEYAPMDLSRTSNTEWEMTSVTPGPTIAPPATTSAWFDTSGEWAYEYQVTSVSADDGSESIASPIASIGGAVNIAATAGIIYVSWAPVAGAKFYNIYKATPLKTNLPPVGALFGYVGTAYGTLFTDPNIVPDFSQVPPQHRNPFARGQVISAVPVSQGSGYNWATLLSTSPTGSGLVAQATIIGGQATGWVIFDPGAGYGPNDTFYVNGDGYGASALVEVGPQSGTYPSVPSYFQQRRVFANSLNKPDTYWMSQPGAFTNFNVRIPATDTDAITGTPWSLQVNGIQFMVQMPSGLIVLTGAGAWLVGGSTNIGSTFSAITPANQLAQAQSYNGCSSSVPPIRIGSDVIYVQAKGSIVVLFEYNFFTNIFVPQNMTGMSSHLFTGRLINEWAWAEEPEKVIWAVRDDGILLSLTYVKAEQVLGWARSDTRGRFKSVCSVTEPPVDAVYIAVDRTLAGQRAYTIERMDNRLWRNVEDVWAVDCGLRLDQPKPNAVLAFSTHTGLGAITGVTGLAGGGGYSSAATAYVVDDNGQGPGTGAVPTVTVQNGVITNVVFAPGNRGSGYVNPRLVFTDPANSGRGASASLILDNSATLNSYPGVFAPANVGDVIRVGGGIAVITGYTSSTVVTAQIKAPITDHVPNTTGGGTIFPSGSWTQTTPVSSVGGLWHLRGETVVGLADGEPFGPVLVGNDGRIDLPNPATSVVAGLSYQAQFQSVYLDTGEPTTQGQRKKVAAVTARIEASRGLKTGANQVDGSTLSPPVIDPVWSGMADLPDAGEATYNWPIKPLFTGDIRVPLPGGFARAGQVAFQQDKPLPMNILAIIPEALGGDTPEQQAKERQGRGQ